MTSIPVFEEKAANLLYLVVKNHSFVDGNKRIAAGLFAHFLERNGILFTETGRPVIDNAALTGLTLMIALSNPQEKAVMCDLVMNCLAMSGQIPPTAASEPAVPGETRVRLDGDRP